MSKSNELAPGVFERKFLRYIFDSLCTGDDYHILTIDALFELYHGIGIVQQLNIQRLRWLGHIVRMDDDSPKKKVFAVRIIGKS